MAQALKSSGAHFMPQATAVWLIENTTLTFRQIAEFVRVTEIEIEGLANEEIGKGIVGRNPIENGDLTREEIIRCEGNSTARLKLSKRELPSVKMRSKGPRYTPVSRRADKPDAIAYILKNNPDIKDSKIARLLGTTKNTINAVRDRTHPNAGTIKPRHPAEIGFCSWAEYEILANKALKAAGKDPEKIKAEQQAKADEDTKSAKSKDDGIMSAGFDFSNFLKGGNSSGGSTDQE